MPRLLRDQSIQRACALRIRNLLIEHGYEEVELSYESSVDHPYYLFKLTFNEQEYEIEVYEDGPVMHNDDDQIFEVYLPEEFLDLQTHCRSFILRLDRYLSGGLWEGADEPNFWTALKSGFTSAWHKIILK